ncbi:DUF4856 domain-containing protein [Riemerella columbina]|uniref:DUF4856 domain-containing protein n=1 Tax=Riemerella columbina TaxID=103810 RepID=UPI0003765AE2|nr:DUF4856 domain-containing protein [Riemerella columbina]
MKKRLILTLMLSTLALTSCSRDGGGGDNGGGTNPPVVNESYDYKFSRDGFSTVDFKEGEALINLFYKLDNGLKSASRFSKNYYQEKGVYGKSLDDITATSIGYYLKNTTLKTEVKQDIDHYFEDLVLIANANQEAKKGIAGWIGYDEERRYVNGYGEETGQVLQKALMGVALLDRINNHHLSSEILNDAKLQKDNSNIVLVSGKKYTELEHHWDMAFAYLGKENSLYKPLFIANYLEKETKDMLFLRGVDERVYKAYYKGRKAVVSQNYDEMKNQAEIINKELGTLFAARAIYYLKKALPDMKEDARNAFHGLSEAQGFIYALNSIRKADGTPYLSHAEVQQLLTDLRGAGGFWDVDRLAASKNTKGSLLNISERIANKFGFKSEDI